MNKFLVILILFGFSCQSNRQLKKDLDRSPVKYWEIVNSTCHLIYADSIEEDRERALKVLEQKLNFERSFISKEFVLDANGMKTNKLVTYILLFAQLSSDIDYRDGIKTIMKYLDYLSQDEDGLLITFVSPNIFSILKIETPTWVYRPFLSIEEKKFKLKNIITKELKK